MVSLMQGLGNSIAYLNGFQLLIDKFCIKQLVFKKGEERKKKGEHYHLKFPWESMFMNNLSVYPAFTEFMGNKSLKDFC